MTFFNKWSHTSASEEEDTRDFTIRETERLKFITGRGEEEKAEDKDKDKDQEEVEEEEEGEGEENERKEVLPPSLILFNKYKALEEEVLAKVGMTKKERTTAHLNQSHPTSLLKPWIKILELLDFCISFIQFWVLQVLRVYDWKVMLKVWVQTESLTGQRFRDDRSALRPQFPAAAACAGWSGHRSAAAAAAAGRSGDGSRGQQSGRAPGPAFLDALASLREDINSNKAKKLVLSDALAVQSEGL